jgi:NADH-quinone oxidoreductase subunit A
MTGFVGYLLLFLAVAVGFIVIHLLLGKLIRPARPDADKLTIYECGEPTIGSAWIQFDLRFYVVALLFVVFDVEVAFFFPWAVVFGQANTLAHRELATPDQVRTAERELMSDSNPAPADQAIVGRRIASVALADILVFFGVLLVGYAYLWKRGDLAWVRSTTAPRIVEVPPPTPEPVTAQLAAGAAH